MSGYFKKPVLSVVASALGLVLLCACAGTKTVTPSGAVSASITASTSAGAVDVQLPSTREVNTYATDGVIPLGCSKQTDTDQGRKVFLISNGQIWQGRAELVCSPDMAAYPTPVSTW